MRLGEWLKSNDLTQEAFGCRVGASKQAVARWVAGENMPRREHIAAITRETSGAVTANDFHGEGGAAGHSHRPSDAPAPAGSALAESEQAKQKAAIVRETAGAVTANDFMPEAGADAQWAAEAPLGDADPGDVSCGRHPAGETHDTIKKEAAA